LVTRPREAKPAQMKTFPRLGEKSSRAEPRHSLSRTERDRRTDGEVRAHSVVCGKVNLDRHDTIYVELISFGQNRSVIRGL
jgi:hypothetical protein